jgi:oxygen-independent coproporphyrinogen III oxidase
MSSPTAKPTSLPQAGGSAASDTRLEVADLPLGGLEGLYVHVPFCAHKCHYCDFYSITRQSPERMNAFVERLLSEGRAFATARAGQRRMDTVFFGGGTPSLLPAAAMGKLVRGLREIFDLGGVTEWTIECNPATVDLAYLEMLRGLGVDRLSFGAQSFNRQDLAALERHHEPEDVPRSLEMARRAGFERLSIDLIFGVPGQKLEDWEQSLGAALACGTSHVSAYLLTYEENTPLAVKKRLGRLVPAAEELEVEMLRLTRRRMREAGLEPYEISNFARPGQECRHNLMYWQGGSYLGLGPSAASHVHGTRWRNKPHLGEWEAAVDSGKLGATAIEVESLTPDHRAAELAYLLIRTRRGIVFSDFANKTGLEARVRFARAIKRLVPAGVMEADDVGLRLTETGIAVADSVAAELLA